MKHHHQDGHPQAPWHRNVHCDWRLWLAVGLMLTAMLMYVLSDNERFRYGNAAGQMSPPVPAMGP